MNTSPVFRIGLVFAFVLVSNILPMTGHAETFSGTQNAVQQVLGLRIGGDSGPNSDSRELSLKMIHFGKGNQLSARQAVNPQDQTLAKQLFTSNAAAPNLGLKPPLNDMVWNADEGSTGPSLGAVMLYGLGFCALIFVVLVLAGTIDVSA